MIFRTSEGEVCFVGRYIGRDFKREASILE